MSRQVLTPTAQPGMFEALKRFFSPANRYLSPLLISCVLLVGSSRTASSRVTRGLCWPLSPALWPR